MDAKKVNLVLAGGGVKGISLVGAVQELEGAGFSFARVAGTSAGAIVGGLLASGFSGSELAQIMREIPYKKFRDEGLLDKLSWPGKIASLLIEKGIYEGDFFCRWYDELLQQKNVHTFADLRADEDYRLYAYAADISRGRLVCFPKDLPELQINADQQVVSHAVRASISIPFYYEPVKLAGNYLVDGGILSNFPIHAFRDDPLPTIGIKLSAEPGAVAKPHKITGPISYTAAVFNTMLSVQDQIHLNDRKAIEQTIFVDTGSIMATEFDLSVDQQQALYDAGRSAARKFLTRS